MVHSLQHPDALVSWPSFQVTFVTFHDRAARHKIGEGAQAHVLDVPASATWAWVGKGEDREHV